jgi:hypothetical protein
MPCFILVIGEYLGDKHSFLMSLDVLDVVNGMEIAVLCQLDSIIFQNIAGVLESSDLSLSSPHLGIVLPHKFYLMLVRELLFQVFHDFINCSSQGFYV